MAAEARLEDIMAGALVDTDMSPHSMADEMFEIDGSMYMSAGTTAKGSFGSRQRVAQAAQRASPSAVTSPPPPPKKGALLCQSPALQHHKPFEVVYEQVTREKNLRKLEALFSAADADHNRSLSLDEFQEAFKIPWVKRAFSALGVQPHQSELVFRRMVFESYKANGGAEQPTGGASTEALFGRGELSVSNFVGCFDAISELCSKEADGELDISHLRRARLKEARVQQLGCTSSTWRVTETVGAAAARKQLGTTARGRGLGQSRAMSTACIGLGLDPGLGRSMLPPEKVIARAFVQTALAKAHYPANASHARR
jgi:hypothetical protein